MERSGADIIIDGLERHGVRIVSGMPGGANLPLYDALARSRIRHVLVRHEQAAGFIAQGMARASGKAGVCLATSGPGATNLVTALADAHLDSIPVVAITGQVPTALLGTSAFQEVDTVAIMRPVVKHAEQVRDVTQLAAAIDGAFELAESGRPGPVVIDVPKDVLQARADANLSPREPANATPPAPNPLAFERFVQLLHESERPVLYIGGGVQHAGAEAAVARFSRLQDLPVVASLMGLGCFDPHEPRYLGMLGMHGAPYTNLVLHEADLLICIGARFDDRATGKASEFCPHARTIHVDIDPRELGKLRTLELGVAADARAFLDALEPRVPARCRTAWLARVAALRGAHPMPPGIESQAATRALRALGRALSPGTIVTTDVGQHQMWVAQLLSFDQPRTLLTSGGLGSMGFGLPAAIGAALQTQRRVVCVSGDGSLSINLQELATLAELELDVTIVLLDNRQLGMVCQQQELFYAAQLSASTFIKPSDFVAIACAFGLEACSLEPQDDELAALPELLSRRGPRLIRVPIPADELVLPMVAPGSPNHRMIQRPPRLDRVPVIVAV